MTEPTTPTPDAPAGQAQPAPSLAQTLYTPPAATAAEPAAAETPVVEAADPPAVEPAAADAAPKPILGQDPAAEEAQPAPLTAESYGALTIPDTISAQPELVDSFKSLALAQSIPPGAAQALVDFYSTALTAQAKATTDAWAETQSAWTSSIQAMPEFQGDARSQSTALLGGLINEYGDPSVREFFSLTGDHPGVIKMMLNLAQALVGEGAPTPQGSPGKLAGIKPNGGAPRTLGQTLYGDTPVN